MYQPANTNDKAANRDALDDAMGDRSFICPSLSLAQQLSSTGVKNYQYRLTHRASNEAWAPWMGVIHGADIQVFKVFSHKSHLHDKNTYKKKNAGRISFFHFSGQWECLWILP